MSSRTRSTKRSSTPARKRTNKKKNKTVSISRKVIKREVRARGRGDYDLVTIGGEPAGEYIGGLLGGSLLGQLGAKVGTRAGGYLHRKLKQYTGIGDYHAVNALNARMAQAGPSPNRLAGVVPTFSNGRDYIEIVRQECVATIGGTTGFTALAFKLNPGDANTFPVSCTEYRNYESAEFIEMLWYFSSYESDNSSGSAVNGSLGQVVLCTDYDPNHTSPGNVIVAMSMEGASSTKGSRDMMHYVECDPRRNPGSGRKYIRSADPGPGALARQDDLGTTYLITNGFPANGGVIGTLWLATRIRLYKPIATAMLNGHSAYFNNQFGYTTSNGVYAWQSIPITNFGGLFTRTRQIPTVMSGSNNQLYTVTLPSAPATYLINVSMHTGSSNAGTTIAMSSTSADLVPFRPTGTSAYSSSMLTGPDILAVFGYTCNGTNDHTPNRTNFTLNLPTWNSDVPPGYGGITVVVTAVDQQFTSQLSALPPPSRGVPNPTSNPQWCAVNIGESTTQYSASGPNPPPPVGTPTVISVATSSGPTSSSPDHLRSRVLRVEGLPHTATDVSLYKALSGLANVVDVQVLRCPDTGRPTGSALVQLSSLSEAEALTGTQVLCGNRCILRATNEVLDHEAPSYGLCDLDSCD